MVGNYKGECSDCYTSDESAIPGAFTNNRVTTREHNVGENEVLVEQIYPLHCDGGLCFQDKVLDVKLMRLYKDGVGLPQLPMATKFSWIGFSIDLIHASLDNSTDRLFVNTVETVDIHQFVAIRRTWHNKDSGEFIEATPLFLTTLPVSRVNRTKDSKYLKLEDRRYDDPYLDKFEIEAYQND